MPSAGRTSMPRRGPAPLTSTFDVTLRIAGSMVTIDLPSTRPMIQGAAWAPLAPKLDAASAPRISHPRQSRNREDLVGTRPRLPRGQRSAVNAIGEIGDAARLGKKDC